MLLLPARCPRLRSRGRLVTPWQGSERGRPSSSSYMTLQIQLKPSSYELLQVAAGGVGLALSESRPFFRALKEGEVGSRISGAGCLCMDLPK